MYLNYGDEMTFTQRFVNFGLNQVLDAVRTFYYLPAMEGVYKEKLGLDAPSVGEIFGRASLLLSNGHVSINRPKPNLPNVIQVGGMHSRKAKELPKVGQFCEFTELIPIFLELKTEQVPRESSFT